MKGEYQYGDIYKTLTGDDKIPRSQIEIGKKVVGKFGKLEVKSSGFWDKKYNTDIDKYLK